MKKKDKTPETPVTEEEAPQTAEQPQNTGETAGEQPEEKEASIDEWRAALETALRLGKRTIAACLGMPDAALRLPEGCEAVCLYGVTWASVRALCRVLRGEISPRGTAPVHLDG